MRTKLLFITACCTLLFSTLTAQIAHFPFDTDVMDTEETFNATASPGGLTFVNDDERGAVIEFSGGIPADSGTAGYLTLDNTVFNYEAVSLNLWLKWTDTLTDGLGRPDNWWVRVFDFGTRTYDGIPNHDVNFFTLFNAGKMQWNIHPFAYPNGTDSLLRSIDSTQYNQWYMLTLTHKAGAAKLYVNGVLNDEVEIAEAPNVFTGFTRCHIGRSNWDDRYFMGRMDEMTFWDKELTQTEIDDLYGGTSGLNEPEISIFQVYSTDKLLRISLNGLQKASISVYNLQGIEVYRNVNAGNITEIKGLNHGIYIVKVSDNVKFSTKKVVLR